MSQRTTMALARRSDVEVTKKGGVHMSGHPTWSRIREYRKHGYVFKTRTVKYHMCLAVYEPGTGWQFSDINTDKLIAFSDDYEMTRNVVYVP